MKKITYLLAVLLLGCQVPHYERTANNGWIENGVEVYPRYETYRTKKNIQLPLPFQQSIMAYRTRFGFFPPSVQAFTQESGNNRQMLKNLHTQGFTKIEFLPIGKDSLAVEFEFMKTSRLYYNTDVEYWIKSYQQRAVLVCKHFGGLCVLQTIH